ncbi:MAG: cob(I)yrinic acid a,c-diamide adenosyltransferase, partial [Patescibacteria group bacterium]
MKIYTRRGDDGQTDLYGSGRIAKSSLRMDAIGTVDELNAVIGEVLTISVEEIVAKMLLEIQRDLFVLGGDLATIGSKMHRGSADVPRVSDERVTELEYLIDQLDASLQPMTAFILPGGSSAGAKLHVARTVCRRAERVCAELLESDGSEKVSPMCVKYLNRLSDLLFTMARY